MATSNNSRDVKMTLSVETLGADGIKQLQSHVSQLAKEGGDAAPEFQKLADEIGRLGEQAGALQAFQALSDETAALSLRQAQAAATAGELKTKLDLLSAETSTAAAAQATVAAELGKAENAARATRDALAVLTAQTAAAKAADEGYAQAVSVLKLAKVEQRAEIERLSSAMTAANADVKTAEAAEAKLANAYRAASAAAELANTATRTNAAAVADAANAALDLGVTTDNVAAAQAELVQGLNKSGQAAQDLEANVKRLADRQRELDEIRAFDKQAEAARRLVTAGEYAGLFDEALQRLAATEREIKAQATEDKWQKEAFALVEAAEAAKKLAHETELLSAVERELAAQAVFEKQHADAARLVQASEYVRDFENALQNLSAAEKASADSTAADKWQKEAFAIVEAAEAAKKLTHDTEVLTAAQRELAAQAAFEKQAEDARKLLQAGEYVKFWTAELAKAETQTQQTAAAAQASSQRISDAFRTLGVRSAEELQAEIVQVRAAMETVGATSSATGSTLSGAFNAGTARVKDLERELRSLNGELTVGDKAAKLFAGSMGQIAAGNLIADGVGYLVNKVKELGRAFLEAVVQGDQMRRGLTAIYKDAEVAARQIDFLRKSSSESGVAFGQLSGEFVKFSASMTSANIPLEQSNNLFKSVTAAATSLGLGTEATAGALSALGQMASKGTVSMEELRQQLGDRLPGAIGVTAKGLNVTEAELVKLVESGQLAFRDFIVPFTEGMKAMHGETTGLVATWQRMKGVLTETSQNAGDSGWVVILTTALKALSFALAPIVYLLSAASEGAILLAEAAYALGSALFGNKKAFADYGDEVSKAALRLENMRNAITGIFVPQKNLTDSTDVATKAIDDHRTAAQRVDEALRAAAGATSLSTVAAKLHADTQLNAAGSIVKYNIEANRLIAIENTSAEAAGVTAKAVKAQGEALIELAKQSGNNEIVARAEAKAALDNAAATGVVAEAKRAEVELMIVQRAHQEEVIRLRTTDEDAIKKETAALADKITKSLAESELATQQAAAAKIEAESRRLATELLKDHSKEIGKYEALMIVAQADVERLTQAEKDGWATKQQVIDAQKRLTEATALRRDGIKDLITNTDVANRLDSARTQLLIAQADASGKHYLSLAAEARALGNTTQATLFEIKAKEEQIKVMKLKLQLDKLQQDAALLEIELKRKLIDETTAEGKIKLQLLDIETQMIKIKQVGNQAALDAIAGIQRETDALRTGINVRKESTAGINTDTGARNANTVAINDQRTALEKIADAQKKADADWKKGSEAANQTKAAPGRVDLSLAQKILDATNTGQTVNMTASEYAQAKEQAKTASDAVQVGLQNASGLVSSESMAQAAAMLRAVMNSSSVNITDKPVGDTSKTATVANSTTTVNVNINGRSTPVNVASQADANALTSILRQLESASGTAS